MSEADSAPGPSNSETLADRARQYAVTGAKLASRTVEIVAKATEPDQSIWFSRLITALTLATVGGQSKPVPCQREVAPGQAVLGGSSVLTVLPYANNVTTVKETWTAHDESGNKVVITTRLTSGSYVGQSTSISTTTETTPPDGPPTYQCAQGTIGSPPYKFDSLTGDRYSNPNTAGAPNGQLDDPSLYGYFENAFATLDATLSVHEGKEQTPDSAPSSD